MDARSSGGCREEDLSTPPQEPQANAWVPEANADTGGARGASPPPPQGPPAAHRVRGQEVGALVAAGSAGPAERRRERLPRSVRVRRRAEYLTIQNQGRRMSGTHLMLFSRAGSG